MQICINGQWQPASEGLTVAKLLESMSLQPLRVAVERNRRIVPRRDYPETLLADRDELEIVTLVGGG